MGKVDLKTSDLSLTIIDWMKSRFEGRWKKSNWPFCLQEYKLMYGMLFSIRSFVSKMSPLDSYPLGYMVSLSVLLFALPLCSLAIFRKEGFQSFQTSRYRLHYFETPSGLKFVMNTDLSVSNGRDALQHIYSNVSEVLCKSTPSSPREWRVRAHVCISAVCGEHRQEPDVYSG